MLDGSWPGWSVAQSAISAGAGLLGVFAGSWMTARNQAAERRRDRIKEQLRDYYAPLLAIRKEIQAKSQLRPKIHDAANTSWQELIQAARDARNFAEVAKKRSEEFEKVIEYSNEQLKTDLVPLYEEMLELCTSKMWLAEKTTVQHYAALSEFVEVWKRFLRGALPVEVIEKLDHSEANLQQFYKDIEDNFDRLGDGLKK